MLSVALYKSFLIPYNHPNLIILSIFNYPFFIFPPSLIQLPTHFNPTLVSSAATAPTCALASREVCSKFPRQVMDWCNSHFSLNLKVTLIMLRGPPWAKSFVCFCSFHYLFPTLSHSVMADNWALFNGVAPAPLKAGVFSQQKADS